MRKSSEEESWKMRRSRTTRRRMKRGRIRRGRRRRRARRRRGRGGRGTIWKRDWRRHRKVSRMTRWTKSPFLLQVEDVPVWKGDYVTLPVEHRLFFCRWKSYESRCSWLVLASKRTSRLQYTRVRRDVYMDLDGVNGTSDDNGFVMHTHKCSTRFCLRRGVVFVTSRGWCETVSPRIKISLAVPWRYGAR
jgi:hypothetical protein